MEATRRQGCFRGSFLFQWGTFPAGRLGQGKMALTDTEIRKAKAEDRACRVSDGSGPYLRITPAGGKLWRWGYDFGGK